MPPDPISLEATPGRRPWARPEGWTVAALAIVAVVVAPMLAVGWMAFHPTDNIWPHLMQTVLPRYVSNT